MALVGYSDSESDGEQAKSAQAILNKKPESSNFSSDRSNPHKIRVNLPEASKILAPRENEDAERPAKKVKTGGSGGFNAMLPAPKITATKSAATGKRLGAGVSLKTSAQAGFSREPMKEEALQEDNYHGREKEEDNVEATVQASNAVESEKLPLAEIEKTEAKTVGNAMIFKPLSVARKPQKKKKKEIAEGAAYASAIQGSTSHTSTTKAEFSQPPPEPKVSLFSTGSLEDPTLNSNTTTTSRREYEPIIYDADATSDPEPDEDATQNLTPSNPIETSSASHESLSDLTSSMNLPPSALRQIFGRSAKNSPIPESINLTTFDVSAEYAHNESLRQSGELENLSHNPVRAVAAGKHSLMQLVNQVANQREALEERFSEGRAKKKEGGSKYGW